MSSRHSEQNFYEVLEVPQSAQHQEIVSAYQRAKEAYSPDSPALYTMFTKEEAAELRKLIEEAFQTLGNQKKRREYDLQLLSESSKANAKSGQDHAPTIEVRNFSNDITPHKPTQSSATNRPANNDKKKNENFVADPQFEKEISERAQFDGAFLKKVRLYKKIELEQIVKETRVSKSYLTAIESDDFSSLPAPVFLRGFLIQLARYLGLKETDVAASYMSRIKKDS